jgi:hypothetical protein
MNTVPTYQTSDFYLATFLLWKSVPLLDIQPTADPRKKAFVFQNIRDLSALIANFWSQRELVEPLSLLTAERELKHRLYADSYKSGIEEK